LTPKKLALTRWLSLGQVLERILDIWSSLLKYFISITDETEKRLKKKSSSMKSEANEKSNRKLTREEIKKLLQNEVFYQQILLLSIIKKIVNKYNIDF